MRSIKKQNAIYKIKKILTTSLRSFANSHPFGSPMNQNLNLLLTRSKYAPSITINARNAFARVSRASGPKCSLQRGAKFTGFLLKTAQKKKEVRTFHLLGTFRNAVHICPMVNHGSYNRVQYYMQWLPGSMMICDDGYYIGLEGP